MSDESTPVLDIIQKIGEQRHAVIFLKYDAFRDADKWTIIDERGRFTDTDDPMAALLKLHREDALP